MTSAIALCTLVLGCLIPTACCIELSQRRREERDYYQATLADALRSAENNRLRALHAEHRARLAALRQPTGFAFVDGEREGGS